MGAPTLSRDRTSGVTRTGGNNGGKPSKRLHHSNEDKQHRPASRAGRFAYEPLSYPLSRSSICLAFMFSGSSSSDRS
jgi:hypothetical protein